MTQQKVLKLWLMMSSLYNNRHVKNSFLTCNAFNINDHYWFHSNNLSYTNPTNKPNYKNGFLICNPICFYFLNFFVILGWRFRVLKLCTGISTRHNHNEKEKEIRKHDNGNYHTKNHLWGNFSSHSKFGMHWQGEKKNVWSATKLYSNNG
jgi:hypothetical protein